MREKDIITKYFSPLSKNAKGADGLNDDIAVLGNLGSGLLAINMDSLVAGTHFFPNDDPAILAQKALRVNLSDLAAKGATPFGYFLALTLPQNTDEAYIASFAHGLAIDQRNFNINLLGGDTVKTTGPLTITITILGLLSNTQVPRRSDAQVGDDIYVTGTIGDGALGLLSHPEYRGNAALSTTYSRHLSHYLCPEPRLEMQSILAGFSHASMDISDGLLGDLEQIVSCSNVSAQLELSKIPMSFETKSVLTTDSSLLSTILTGGDDYEILFTASPQHGKAINQLAQKLHFGLHKIGTIVESQNGENCVILSDKGQKIDVSNYNLSHSHTW